MHLSQGPGAQRLFRHKWRKPGRLLWFLFVLVIVVAWLNKTSFFICGSGIWLKFSRIELLLKRLQLGSKTDLNTSGLISKFFLKYASFRHRQICADWQKQALLVYVCLWGHQVPSRINLTSFPICTLFVLEVFRLKIFRKPVYELYQWTKFSFSNLKRLLTFCLASSDEHFFNLLPKSSFPFPTFLLVVVCLSRF